MRARRRPYSCRRLRYRTRAALERDLPAAIAACVLFFSFGTSVALAAWTLPNAVLTPGAIGSSDPNVVCVRGYSRTVRPAYTSQWRRFRVAVFRAYGIPHERWRNYTLDHLIPLAIGGAPQDLRNVWPEPKIEAKRKDEVEDALIARVCYRHILTLHAAQDAIARNWSKTPVGLPPVRRHRYGTISSE